MYVIKVDGSEVEISRESVLIEVSNGWEDKQIYKFFLKKKTEPLVIKVNPEFFTVRAWFLFCFVTSPNTHTHTLPEELCLSAERRR